MAISILTISCQNGEDITEELIGNWVYERETFNHMPPMGEVKDVSGLIKLEIDGTGFWDPSIPSLNSLLEWQVDKCGDQITIIKTVYVTNVEVFPKTRIYELKRTDENNFTLTYLLEGLDEMTNTMEVLEFENIILTRKP